MDEALAQVVERAIRDRSRVGYFAALYRRVTQAVAEGLAAGRFRDPQRLERLAVAFANRYFDALDGARSGTGASRSWQVSFEAAHDPSLLILQQLLLGMNAHINLDLGVAVAEVCSADDLPAFRVDFDEMNAVLFSLVDTVQREVDELSPWLGLLDRVGGRTDERIFEFSMKAARDEAWRSAQRLAALSGDDRSAAIAKLDGRVALLGRLVTSTPLLVGVAIWLIRRREERDPRVVIRALGRA